MQLKEDTNQAARLLKVNSSLKNSSPSYFKWIGKYLDNDSLGTHIYPPQTHTHTLYKPNIHTHVYTHTHRQTQSQTLTHISQYSKHDFIGFVSKWNFESQIYPIAHVEKFRENTFTENHKNLGSISYKGSNRFLYFLNPFAHFA